MSAVSVWLTELVAAQMIFAHSSVHSDSSCLWYGTREATVKLSLFCSRTVLEQKGYCLLVGGRCLILTSDGCEGRYTGAAGDRGCDR